MIVDRVTRTDIPQLLRIQEECGLSAWTSEGYEVELARADSMIFGSRDTDAGVIGFIAGRMYVADSPDGVNEAEIYNIGTLPKYRKQGIGSRLIKHFLEAADDRRVTRIWLEVRAGNLTAQRFYSSHGFEIAGRRKDFYSNPAEDALVMSLKIRRASTKGGRQPA